MTRDEYLKLCNTVACNNWGNHGHEIHQWWMQQHAEEFWQLLEKCNGAKKILEIGTNHGGTLVFWDQLAGKDGRVVGVDIDPTVSLFDRTFSPYRPVSNLKIIIGDSHKDDVACVVANHFHSQPIDVLFIDGDHSYEGAKEDYNMYGVLVREGGIIAIHDVAIEPRVKRLWDEIDKPKELIHLGGPSIGIVYA